jgi:hypothetical protein
VCRRAEAELAGVADLDPGRLVVGVREPQQGRPARRDQPLLLQRHHVAAALVVNLGDPGAELAERRPARLYQRDRRRALPRRVDHDHTQGPLRERSTMAYRIV